jgi:hypothetical protein
VRNQSAGISRRIGRSLQEVGTTEVTTRTAPRRYWLRALLSVLIAVSIVLHLGQAPSALADTEVIEAVTADHRDSSCESGHGLTTMHCQIITACSLYAPLETSPVILIPVLGHPGPVSDAVHATWTASPGLQPPQYSLWA